MLSLRILLGAVFYRKELCRVCACRSQLLKVDARRRSIPVLAPQPLQVVLTALHHRRKLRILIDLQLPHLGVCLRFLLLLGCVDLCICNLLLVELFIKPEENAPHTNISGPGHTNGDGNGTNFGGRRATSSSSGVTPPAVIVGEGYGAVSARLR